MFYDNQWIERIKRTSELKYLKVNDLDRVLLANLYRYQKEIEFLQKINASEIAEEVMYPKYIRTDGKYVKTIGKRN